MAFDPLLPADNSHGSAAEMRSQLTGLDDKIIDANHRIDNIPPAFPCNGDAEINGNIKATGSAYIQGMLGFITSDPGGSGETGLRIASSDNGNGPIPVFIARQSGATQSQFGIDGSGIINGAGVPTVQNGAILRWDDTAAAYKPWNVTVQTLNLMDSSGNPITVQIIVPT